MRLGGRAQGSADLIGIVAEYAEVGDLDAEAADSPCRTKRLAS